ncbi:MAG: SDR family NAD(P)-dependent oxidoreductase [Bacteroidales bacterium]|nr:SDR family NAD(P)-dependent oxidoreductase [Bacteroidales bacterium]
MTFILQNNEENMMKDKICLVTGGSSGVGKATATGLAALGAEIILVSRDESKAGETISLIKMQTGNEKISWMYADFSVQSSIKEFAARFKERYDRLHLLSNTAGMIQLNREETPEGIEKTLAVDYLSHFLISNLLIDLLRKGSPSRIITVAGGLRLIRNVKINFNDIQFQKGYNGLKAAVQAARARVVFSAELAGRLSGTGITSNAFQPGFVKTGMGNNFPQPLRFMSKLIQPFLSNECKTSVYLASSPEVENITGKFFGKSKPHDFSYDPAEGKRLWELSLQLTGL